MRLTYLRSQVRVRVQSSRPFSGPGLGAEISRDLDASSQESEGSQGLSASWVGEESEKGPTTVPAHPSPPGSHLGSEQE